MRDSWERRDEHARGNVGELGGGGGGGGFILQWRRPRQTEGIDDAGISRWVRGCFDTGSRRERHSEMERQCFKMYMPRIT